MRASSAFVARLAVRLSLSLVLLSAATILPAADGANVLVFMPCPLKSHVGGFRPMFEELARRGHNVTVASAFPSIANRIANLTDLAVPLLELNRGFDLTKVLSHNFITTVTGRWFMASFISTSMDNKVVQDLIQSESNSFDVVLIESFFQEYTVALGHKFNAPVINLSPAMVWVSISKWSHVPSTFSYVPDCCIGVTDTMSFIERLKNTIVGVIQLYVENYLYIPMIKSLMAKYFTYKGWESRPPLEQMLNNVSLTLMNAHQGIGVCRPLHPGVIEVGGMHIKDPKPLPHDLQAYIESATHGVIYFSFGSVVNISDLPENILKLFLNVLGRLKQKVILKWAPNSKIKLPQNVKIGSWLPQNDILAHENVKLFITHGGFHSLVEATVNAKPLVGIPFFADQVSNMKNVENKGYGKTVLVSELTEELFESVIKEVLSNQKFTDQAIIQSVMFRDQPTKPLDRAIYWIEYVIRNGGAKHLISDSVQLNDAQYFLFDVTLVLLVPTVLVIWLGFRGTIKITNKLGITQY